MQKKNDSFAQQMASIGKQAEAERLEEIKAEQRRALYGKIRKVMLVLVLVVATGFAWQQRGPIKAGVAQLAEKTGLAGGNGKSLTGYSEANDQLKGQVGELQAVAAQRAALIDDIAGGPKPAAAPATASVAAPEAKPVTASTAK
jgi:hypothetical protein